LKISDLTCDKINKGDCGGEGVAFVASQSGSRASGGAGANMGYGTIPTAYAIEFDTNSNPATSDPNMPKKRHISIIRKKANSKLIDTPGVGQTIGWFDMPFNFNNPDEEGYLDEVNVKIEFFNLMFKVYINNAV